MNKMHSSIELFDKGWVHAASSKSTVQYKLNDTCFTHDILSQNANYLGRLTNIWLYNLHNQSPPKNFKRILLDTAREKQNNEFNF